MSPKLKTQLGRILRLAGLAVVGSLTPFILGLHGAPTLALIEGAAMVAGEAGWRAIYPTIQADLVYPTPEVAQVDRKIPPAVF